MSKGEKEKKKKKKEKKKKKKQGKEKKEKKSETDIFPQEHLFSPLERNILVIIPRASPMERVCLNSKPSNMLVRSFSCSLWPLALSSPPPFSLSLSLSPHFFLTSLSLSHRRMEGWIVFWSRISHCWR